MARDRAIGAALVAGAVIGVIIYFSLMFLISDRVALLVLKITAFVAVLGILAILGWIGYVMATTPPPVPLEPEPVTTTESASTTSPTSSTSTPGASSSEKKQ
jgi:predicted DNA-binding transcriptional regulator